MTRMSGEQTLCTETAAQGTLSLLTEVANNGIADVSLSLDKALFLHCFRL